MIDTFLIADAVERTLGTAAYAVVPLAYSYLQVNAFLTWKGLFRWASLVPAAAIAVWFHQMRADVAWSDVSSVMLIAEIWFLALPAGFALLCIGSLQAMAAREAPRAEKASTGAGSDTPASADAATAATAPVSG